MGRGIMDERGWNGLDGMIRGEMDVDEMSEGLDEVLGSGRIVRGLASATSPSVSNRANPFFLTAGCDRMLLADFVLLGRIGKRRF
jgi:hypothetical protein